MTIQPIQTMVGEADVLHRLALAVDCRDAVTRARSAVPVRIGREVPALLLPRGHDPAWPCWDLPAKGTARAVLEADARTPKRAVLRLVDPGRRVVARRFGLTLWTLADVRARDAAGTPTPGLSRLLRPWLLPGPSAPLSRGLTTLRGTVRDAAGPVRWARITAYGPGNQPVGWAHADERGEFVLVVEGTGTLPPPAPTTLALRLEVSARKVRVPVDPGDPYADLVVEQVPRSPTPPGPGDLENDVLRGRRPPPEYVVSSQAAPPAVAQIGQQVQLPDAVPFVA